MSATFSFDKLKKSKLGKRTFFSTKKKGGVATYSQEPSPTVFPSQMPTSASDPNPILSNVQRETQSSPDTLESFYAPDMVVVTGNSAEELTPEIESSTPSLALPVVLSQIRDMFAGTKLDELFVNADAILKFSNKEVAYALYLAYNANDPHVRDQLLNTITREDLVQFLDDIAHHPETALLFKKAVLAFFDAHLLDRYTQFNLADAPRATFPSKLTEEQRNQLLGLMSEYRSALDTAVTKADFEENEIRNVPVAASSEMLSESERAFRDRLEAALMDERFRTYFERYFAPLNLENKHDALDLLQAYYSTATNSYEILGKLPYENATAALEQLEARSGHIQNEFNFFKNFILNHYAQASRPTPSVETFVENTPTMTENLDEVQPAISEERRYHLASFVETMSDEELQFALTEIQNRLENKNWQATELPVGVHKIRPPRLKRRLLIRF